MALSILYCRECSVILAASPGLNLAVECASHTVGGASHKGCVALRLPDVGLIQGTLDLEKLAVQFPKSSYVSRLEPVGNCG